MPRFLFALLFSSLFILPAKAQEQLLGFSAEGSDAQRAAEAQYDQHIDAADLEAWMREFTSKAQHVGSPGAKENAEILRDLAESWGFDAEIEVFHVLFPTPKERHVELLGPTQYMAVLEEPVIEGDASSANREHMLPPFNAYSADGDVTGELVYVNQGIPLDYEELAKRGISVEGKIVIARYGGSWRGIKPKVAFEHGAIACILYSDPRDDGYFRGDVYPEGAFKMEYGTQRGSVADMPQFPGDPLTPFVGAKEDTERLALEEAPTLMQIPVLPISYADALPLLEAIGGPVAPEYWRGALPITYHIGPGPATVRVKLAFNWDVKPAYNVIAKMEGSEYPDEWIMRGNHRDAWVFGAQDPTSGTVAMMAEMKAIGELAKSGWRPKRTIVYGSWDAEEPGLLGSTEWVEYHREELDQKLAVYLNTDSNARGFLGMGGSHTLEPFINQVARDVTDPQTGVSVLERRRARDLANGSATTPEKGDLPINPLGSGSDYTPFLQHMGISSLNIGFGGEGGGGSYHSAYDTYEHYTRFGDPGYDYGVALAQVAGRATMRLANADILPYRLTPFTHHVANYLDEVEELAESMRAERERYNDLVTSGRASLALDPLGDILPPAPKSSVPHLSTDSARNAFDRLEEAAEKAQDALLGATASPELNQALMRLERSMTDEDGLPKRSWFRHQIYAPGFYTGYGVKTLPGIREA
ncbi:MAG: M28 family peptidase, partial [Bacteroidota bacterium]|nr:M28 family peptidase [Bacteroidota bacterium]